MAFATPKLLIGVAVIMTGIYAADQSLARLEQRELDAEARHLAQSGRQLAQQGRRAAAIDAFRRAHVLDRDNEVYTIGLANALLADHQPDRAEEVLSEVLDEDSNDGEANLLMARAMTQEGHFTSADSYYHRAVYGTWPAAAGAEAVKARLELAHWLAQQNDGKGLLAELLPLEEFAKTNPQIARELPGLFQRAGSPARAADAYRTLIESNANDAQAYEGLGRVELESGNFHSARQALERAAELKPDDESLRRLAEVAHLAFELDPTLRRLSSGEKLERSNRILQIAADTFQPCGDSPQFIAARRLLTQKAAATNEAAEVRLDFAMRIWNSRPDACQVPPDRMALLNALLHKVSQ